ncbi:MAG: (d)CMP kinase [Alphaproteobacteria bacterium]|nr:(d)CMP kinase [Alphaproteobacteria bacterium]
MSPQQSDEGSLAPLVVAIDGPAASGKGTLARRIARAFDLAYLDTGLLYRATAFLVLEAGADPADPAAAEAAARGIEPRLFVEPGLRGEAVSQAASVVAAIPAVRQALLGFQRAFAQHPPAPAASGQPCLGAVLDGRDIGTVVCPEAAVKLFVTASPQERARRRAEELRQGDAAAIYEDVLQDMKERDARDSGRREAPLAAAPDALIIDTTAMDADQVFAQAAERITRVLAARH